MITFYRWALAGLAMLLLIPACLEDTYGLWGPESDIVVSWTAYKFPGQKERVPVSGTFTNISVGGQIDKSDHCGQDISCLAGAEISINALSALIPSNFEATQNLINFFFKHFADDITGRILAIDNSAADIEIVINEIRHTSEFSVMRYKDDLQLKGRIEDIRLFFLDGDPLRILNAHCGSYHQDKVWEDVDLEVVIPNYLQFL